MTDKKKTNNGTEIPSSNDSRPINREGDSQLFPDPEEEPGGKMSLVEHIAEIRRRIIISLISWFIGSIAGWYLSPTLISYTKNYPQLKDIQFILIRPPEAFFVRLKVAIVFGLLVALPIIIYEVLAFLMPAFHKKEKKWVLRFIPASMILFYGGAAFSVLVLLPITLDFFLVKLTKGIAVPLISLEEYVNYLLGMTLVGGIIFQMPIVLFFLTLMGVLSSRKLRAGRRYAILLVFIVAAFATPPDPFSQVVVAVPMLILYELCVWASKLAGK